MTGLERYASRDWHLETRLAEGKRILALDGGGVRGLVSLGILKRIEETLAPRYPGKPSDFRLCHYFDLIAGTSTGAIIAAALALGMSVDEIRRHYVDMCPRIFEPQSDKTWLGYLAPQGAYTPLYPERELEQVLQDIVGMRELQSPDLQTGLMICAKRIDTASPWVLTNCPRAPYWEKGRNNQYLLWRLLRASTAAPLFFEPVEVVVSEPDENYDGEVGVFVDGAVAGLNNPSLQAFLVATLKPYGFAWPCGNHNLFVVSVGTGAWRNRQNRETFKKLPNWMKAREAISGMIPDTSQQVLVTLQALSNPRKPSVINTEIHDLAGELCRDEELLSFQRYDASLEERDVQKVFPDAKLDMTRLRDLGNTDPDILRRLYTLGHAVGNVSRRGYDGIEPADFPAIFDPPGFGPAA
jgi:predicted acylesterase/phospholipase RssA